MSKNKKNTALRPHAEDAYAAELKALAKTDDRFGDVQMLETLQKNITQSLLKTGKGTKLNNAFDVVTFEEETYILMNMGVKLISTDSRQLGITYYNMHLVEDRITGDRRTVFINTSIPMRHLEEQQKEFDKRTAPQDLRFKG